MSLIFTFPCYLADKYFKTFDLKRPNFGTKCQYHKYPLKKYEKLILAQNPSFRALFNLRQWLFSQQMIKQMCVLQQGAKMKCVSDVYYIFMLQSDQVRFTEPLLHSAT